jgi:hypothetical protein
MASTQNTGDIKCSIVTDKKCEEVNAGEVVITCSMFPWFKITVYIFFALLLHNAKI